MCKRWQQAASYADVTVLPPTLPVAELRDSDIQPWTIKVRMFFNLKAYDS